MYIILATPCCQFSKRGADVGGNNRRALAVRLEADLQDDLELVKRHFRLAADSEVVRFLIGNMARRIRKEADLREMAEGQLRLLDV